MDIASIRSILVLRFDRIGDMVRCTPLLEALKEALPAAELCVLASRVNAPVLDGNPHVDRVHVWDPSAGASSLHSLRDRRFDLCVDPYWEYELAWARLARDIGARYRLGLDAHGRGLYHNIRVPGPLPPLPAAELMLEIVRRGLGLALPSRPPRVFLCEGEAERGAGLLERAGISLDAGAAPPVLLHPGGHYPSQRWPAARFAALARSLSDSGKAQAALVGGPGDEALLSEAAASAAGLRVLRTRSLRDLAAVLSSIRLLACNNSGPLHLACALGVSTVSTMGPSDPVLWTPGGAGHRVLSRRPLELLGTEEMLQAVLEALQGVSFRPKS